MFNLDLPFCQAIPAWLLPPVRFCMPFILAGIMVIAVPLLFYFSRHNPPIAVPWFFEECPKQRA
jgi:hypothetical protein